MDEQYLKISNPALESGGLNARLFRNTVVLGIWMHFTQFRGSYRPPLNFLLGQCGDRIIRCSK